MASSMRYQVFADNAWANVVSVVPALFCTNSWLPVDSSMRAAVPVALRMSSSRVSCDGSGAPGL